MSDQSLAAFDTPIPAGRAAPTLPLLGLLALSTASFLTILTEALPAGLLPQIGADLGVSEAMAGQLITIYAIGSFLAAIPLTAATRTWRRRPLLLSAIAGFLLANTVTAVVDSYGVVLVARFVGGVAAGLLWALMAGYAARIAPPNMAGRAMTIALAGTPVALSIGIPAATFVGLTLGWRSAFWLMSLVSVVLIGWVMWMVPDFAGEDTDGDKPSLRKVFVLPGVRPALFVAFAFVLAHNILYTYIAPLVQALGTIGQTDRVLLAFGVVALASIGVVGTMIDRWLRPLIMIGLGLFLLAALVLTIATGSSLLVYAAAAIWGLAFGGFGPLIQTATLRSAGDAADVATSMIVTLWNVGIAGGAIGGGLVLDHLGSGMLPWSLLVLLIPALAVVVLRRTFGAHRAASHPGAR
ncbi:MFS transporter [Microvirga sp. 3-52]|nr:MFS transporter [Microvirga sp. 3-52]